MTQREQNMAAAVGCVAGTFVVGVIFYFFYLVPSWAIADDMVGLEQEIADKKVQVDKLAAEKRRLERFRLMSLPSVDAQLQYVKFLEPLLKECGFEDRVVTPHKVVAQKAAQGKKPPPHKPITFGVEAKGELANVVKFLVAMDRAPVVHRIKTLSLASETGTSGSKPGRLTIRMTIEGLIVHGSERRSRNLTGPDSRLIGVNALSALRGGPTAIALVPWVLGPGGPLDRGRSPERPDLNRLFADALKQAKIKGVPFWKEEEAIHHAYYADMVKRNIFLGGQPPPRPPEPKKPFEVDPDDPGDERPTDAKSFNILKVITLSMIKRTPGKDAEYEGMLHNKRKRENELGEYTRLSKSHSGYQKFAFRDGYGKPAVEGVVLRIDARDVYYSAKGGIYKLSMGDSLYTSLLHPLTPGELRLAGLAPQKKEDPAKVELGLLKGPWKYTSEEGKRHVLVLDDDSFTLTWIDDDEESSMKGKVKLDIMKKPRHMDLIVASGTGDGADFKGRTLRAIYELAGDKLKWCLSADTPESRPTTFPDMDAEFNLVFRRVK
jgi:uncharacterized protein (TIGR03067 family)